MNYCKIGKVSFTDAVRIEKNYEDLGEVTGDRSCYFTTGFLNGLFMVLEGKRVHQVKQNGTDGRVNEWELR